MNQLLQKLEEQKAHFIPANEGQILHAEETLGITFNDEYKNFLLKIGVVSYQSIEVYGLGVSEESYLNLCIIVPQLREFSGYPLMAVPIFEIGDGHYYLYNNENGDILCWSSPNGGVYKKIEQNLEAFLLDQFFSKNVQ